MQLSMNYDFSCKPEVGATRNTPAKHYWLHFAYQNHTNS